MKKLKIRHFTFLSPVFILLLIFVMQPFLLFSDTQALLSIDPSYIKFDSFTVEDGLSSNDSSSILQDQYGYIWISSNLGGISRFDGTEFKTYMKSNTAWRINADTEGGIWAVTWGEGISHYSPEKDQFINFSHDSEDGKTHLNDFVWHVLKDSYGILWTGSEGGLSQYNPESQTFMYYRHNPDDPASLSNDKVSWIVEGDDGILWLATYGGGLNRFDRTTGHFKSYRHDPSRPGSLGNDYLWCLEYEKDGTILIGTEGGLDRFDPITEEFTHYSHDQDDPYSLSDSAITAILRDSRGNLWLGSNGYGLNLYDPALDGFHHFYHDPDDPGSLLENTVWSLYEDSTGGIWISTFGGVNRYNGMSHRFTTFQHQPGNPSGLCMNSVQCFLENEDGKVWIGTRGGLDLYDPDDGSFTHYINDPENPNSLGNNSVFKLIQDKSGNLWIASNDSVDQFNPKSGVFSHLTHDPLNPNSLIPGTIRDLDFDLNGKLWIGSYGGGLSMYDPKLKVFTHYKPDNKDPNSLVSEWVYAVMVDSSGKVWVGADGGLSVLDAESGIFTNYISDPDKPYSINGSLVNTIYEDPNGTILVGTSQGLNIFKPENQTFQTYTISDGLPSNNIMSIMYDQNGGYWIGTNKGISHYLKELDKFRNYDKRDGLQGDHFRRGAIMVDETGLVYIGGSNGFNTFHPAQIKDNPYIPEIVITDFLIFNKSVPVREDSLMPKHISVVDELTITYKESVFSFEFAGISFLYPEKNQYAYRMEGFEEDWTFVDSTRRFAIYTNLNPGRYTFHVKGSNNDGLWNEKGRSVRLIVSPPWWKIIWVQILFVIAVLFVIWGFIYLRIKSIDRQRRRLELEVKERIKSEKRFKQVLENVADSIFIHDLKGHIVECNQTACSYLGYSREEILNLDVLSIEAGGVSQEDSEILWNSLKQGETTTIEGMHSRKDGTTFPVEIRLAKMLFPEGEFIIALARDITERQSLEKRRQQSLKMEAIGTLSGGIAHDFNNILAGIIGYTELASGLIDKESQVKEYLDDVLNASMRAKKLIQQILTFSRASRHDEKIISINQIVNEAITLIRSTIPTTIEIRHIIPQEKLYIKIDPTQLHQVILNICTNAYHAMKENGGVLEIRLDSIQIQSNGNENRMSLQPGNYVKLLFSDTGIGIDNLTVNRVFEPFFTTKSKESGTGMGLAVVHGIVKKYGGEITIASKVGEGTVFTVYLPLVETYGGEEEGAPSAGSLLKGKGHILCAEDQPDLRRLMKKSLELLGYTVSCAEDGQKAFDLFRENPDRYDLIVTDQAMPHLSGYQLGIKVLELRKDIPVIICTGYNDTLTEQKVKESGIRRLMFKPILREDLSKVIHEVLSGRSL